MKNLSTNTEYKTNKRPIHIPKFALTTNRKNLVCLKNKKALTLSAQMLMFNTLFNI